MTYVGQSEKLYFIKLLVDGNDFAAYDTRPKIMPEGAKVSNVEMDTVDGIKELELWEYTETYHVDIQWKNYFDPSTGISYKFEESYEGNAMDWWKTVEVLKEQTVEWQESYKESDSIGKAFEYTSTGGWETRELTIECIADCLDDKYGVSYSYGTEVPHYYLCDTLQGLPTGAAKKGADVITDSIDGNVSVDVWEYVDVYGSKSIYYVGQTSKMIYEIHLGDGNEIFVLTKIL
jgi:hypothetical protein